MTFDEEVEAIRNAGVFPKSTSKPKSRCTPREWAALREYMVIRYRDPVCRAKHKESQRKYLAKKKS